MRVAEVLADLISLKAADPEAAQALVSIRPEPKAGDQSQESADSNTDLQKAKELIRLNHSMQTIKGTGQVNPDLLEARRKVKELGIA